MNDSTQSSLFEVARPPSSLDQPLPTVTGAGAPRPVPRLSTGVPALDEVLDGGFAQGRVVDVFGPRDAAFSDLEIAALLAAQKAGRTPALIDGAHTFDEVEAAAEGLDVSRLLVSQPDTMEQAFEIVESLARSGAVDLVVVDGMPPGEDPARIVSERMGILAHVCSRSGATLVFLRELAEDVADPHGPALSFHASQRINLRRREGLVFAYVSKDRDGTPGGEACLTER